MRTGGELGIFAGDVPSFEGELGWNQRADYDVVRSVLQPRLSNSR